MFDTESFILEVQQRECLWNPKSKAYNDRVSKRNSWREIAAIFHENWDAYTSQQQRVEDLTKKWKHVRDYYIKERRTELNNIGRKSTKRKRKYNYYDLLTFLDPIKSRPSTSIFDHQDNGNFPRELPVVKEDQSTDMDMSDQSHAEESSAPAGRSSNSQKNALASAPMTPFQKKLLSSLDKTQEKDPNVEANKCFLLSLLPEVTALDERQSMQFRLGILNMLNDIKFGTGIMKHA